MQNYLSKNMKQTTLGVKTKSIRKLNSNTNPITMKAIFL